MQTKCRLNVRKNVENIQNKCRKKVEQMQKIFRTNAEKGRTNVENILKMQTKFIKNVEKMLKKC